MTFQWIPGVKGLKADIDTNVVDGKPSITIFCGCKNIYLGPLHTEVKNTEFQRY